jgi:tetratricopeptide (TPR) repeat protein
MTSLTRHVSAPSAAPEAPRIVHHALASEDRDTAAAWGPAAVEYLFKAGRYDEAVTAADRLLPVCRERLARVYLLGYRAPSLYRLGRFDESLKTYDNWYTTKGDDETKVETVKHRLFTGQVLMACGERTAAREKFLAVLKTGDPESHPNLRAFHARAHALLASLCEQAGSHSETEDHLRRAEALTQNEPVLRADIENQWGLREQDRGRFPEARSRFEAAVWSSQSANDAQSEAIAWNNLAMLDRERGDFSKALQESDRALELARQGNEITQIARYRQNRALVLKDLARLPEAFSEMAASDDVLAVYAGDDLRHLSERHRNDLENLNFDTTGWDLSTDEIACREGPRFRALEGLQSLERRGPDVPESDMARAIAGIAALESPLLRAALLARLAKRLAQWKLKGLAGWLSQKVQAEAHTIHRQLPEERQWTNKKSAA